MKRFTQAGRAALKTDNLYAALSLALIVPDICASLEDPGPGKSEQRYKKWYEQWVEPKVTMAKSGSVPGFCFLPAFECYQLRCSLIHSGSVEIATKKPTQIRRAVFFDNSTSNHMNQIGNWLQMNVDSFCVMMFDSAEAWDAAVAQDAIIQKRKETLLAIHSKGAVIDGVQFG